MKRWAEGAILDAGAYVLRVVYSCHSLSLLDLGPKSGVGTVP